jgi:hypothetical protein
MLEEVGALALARRTFGEYLEAAMGQDSILSLFAHPAPFCLYFSTIIRISSVDRLQR